VKRVFIDGGVLYICFCEISLSREISRYNPSLGAEVKRKFKVIVAEAAVGFCFNKIKNKE